MLDKVAGIVGDLSTLDMRRASCDGGPHAMKAPAKKKMRRIDESDAHGQMSGLDGISSVKMHLKMDGVDEDDEFSNFKSNLRLMELPDTLLLAVFQEFDVRHCQNFRRVSQKWKELNESAQMANRGVVGFDHSEFDKEYWRSFGDKIEQNPTLLENILSLIPKKDLLVQVNVKNMPWPFSKFNEGFVSKFRRLTVVNSVHLIPWTFYEAGRLLMEPDSSVRSITFTNCDFVLAGLPFGNFSYGAVKGEDDQRILSDFLKEEEGSCTWYQWILEVPRFDLTAKDYTGPFCLEYDGAPQLWLACKLDEKGYIWPYADEQIAWLLSSINKLPTKLRQTVEEVYDHFTTQSRRDDIVSELIMPETRLVFPDGFGLSLSRKGFDKMDCAFLTVILLWLDRYIEQFGIEKPPQPLLKNCLVAGASEY